MIATVPRNSLIPVLERCAGACDRKSAMPALENVLLEAKPAVGDAPATLHLLGTDLYMATAGLVVVTADVPFAPGAVSVNARALLERVKVMPPGGVTISRLDGEQVDVGSEVSKRRFRMHGLPGAEHPRGPALPVDASWNEIDAKRLAWLLRATSYAMSNDATRPHVHATLIEWEGDRLAFVATDGHRLARASVSALATRPASWGPLHLLVSATAIDQIAGLAEVATGPVRIAAVGPHLFVESSGYVFWTKLTDGQFPPYKPLLAGAVTNAPHRVLAERNALREALDAVKLSTSDGILALVLRSNALVVSTTTKDEPAKGGCVDRLVVEYAGPDMALGMNAKLLREALDVMPEGKVEVYVGSELDAVRSCPSTMAEGEEMIAITMPAKVDLSSAAKAAA